MKLVVPLLLISLACADDFFWPDEDEAEELDDEVEFPGGAHERSSPAAPPPRTKESIPRDPFTFKLFDHAKLTWRDPAHEQEHMEVVKEQLSTSWQAAVYTFNDESTRKSVGQNQHMLKKLRADKLLRLEMGSVWFPCR